MKFSCPKCSTRYTVADEKVPPAAVLRFTCKKCSNVMRLRRKANGETVPAPEQQEGQPVAAARPAPRPHSDVVMTRVASIAEINRLRDHAARPVEPTPHDQSATRIVSSEQLERMRKASVEKERAAEQEKETARGEPPPEEEELEWHVIVAGKQQGPIGMRTLEAMLARREIDKRTYVWRDGMEKWARIGTVPELSEHAAKCGGAAWRVIAPVDGHAKQAESASAASAATTKPRRPARVGDEEPTLVGAGEAATPSAAVPEAPTPAPATREEVLQSIPQITDPQLINALAGIPTGESMERKSGVLPEDPFEEHGAVSGSIGYEPSEQPTAALNGPSIIGSFPTLGDDMNGPSPAVDPGYYNAPPGESTRVFMHTAGLYRRRRTNRIAAIAAIAMTVVLACIVSLDIAGLVALPGMGVVYDVTGMADPNTERAVTRVEAKLESSDLTPEERARLEGLRAMLLTDPGKPSPSPRPRPSSAASKTNDAPMPTQGVVDSQKLSTDQRTVAADIFGSSEKRETKLALSSPETMQAPPNLPNGLTQEAIFKVISENSRSMNLCLTESMRKGENLSGKMEIELTIVADGSVSEARVDSDAFRSTAMAGCTVRRVKSWRFPQFNGEPVTVSYPYLLQAQF